MSSTILQSPGFSEMEPYTTKREQRHINIRNKYWRNSHHNRAPNQSRLNKLSVDLTKTNESEHNGVTVGATSPGLEVPKNLSKDCNGISADHLEKIVESQTCHKGVPRPKHLNLDRSFCASTAPDKAPSQRSPPDLKSSKGLVRTKSDRMKMNSIVVHDGITRNGSQQTKRQTYTSDYLLGLRKIPPSLEKPDLPSIPGIILCKPVLSTMMTSNSSVKTPDASPLLSPPSAAPGPTPSRPRSPAKLTLRRRAQKSSASTSKNKRKGMDQRPRRIIIGLNLNGEVTLHTSENAWRASSVKKKFPDTFRESLEDMCNRLRGLLNKLSATNFNIISDQISCLNVTDEEVMMMIVEIIFEKAIMEPNFSELYAALARKFSQWTVPASHGRMKFVTFKDLIITRCQHEFEKHKYGESDTDLLTPTGECAPTSRSEVDVADVVKKRRTLGNIRFIGELFMQDMLQEVVIHQCIVDLLKYRPDEDRLESLCKMLTVVGRKIDFIRSKPRIDQYFKRISDILHRKEISSRIKFMLRDIIELRENNWIPRHLNSKPQFLRQSSMSSYGGFSNGWISPAMKSLSVDESKMYNTLPRNFAFNQKPHGKMARKEQDLKDAAWLETHPSVLSRNAKLTPNKECNGMSYAPSLSSGMDSERWELKAPFRSGQDGSYSFNHAKKQEEKDEELTRKGGYQRLTPEQLERRFDHFLNEYLNVEDFQEAGLFFEEMQGDIERCCESLIIKCLEKNFVERSKLGDLFIFALTKGHLSADSLIKSIGAVLCCSEDLEIDIPKVWEYLAEILFKVVLSDQDGFVNKMFGKASPLVTSHFEKLMKFLSNTLKVVCDKKSVREATHFHLKINNFNERCQVGDLQDHMSYEFDGKHVETLRNILQQEEWFPEMKLQQFEKDVVKDHHQGMLVYVKLLVKLVGQEVTSSCEPHSIDVCKLKKACNHFRKLSVENNFGMELLDAAQEFVCSINHPFGVLRGFFDVFYDEDVVPEDDFDRWYADDSVSMPGKGIAKESVRKFFEWLHQSEDEGQDPTVTS